jgi:hypothetical protein
MVPTLGRPVLATPCRAFILDEFPSLASSAQCLLLIGFDNVFFGINYFSMFASTTSLTSSLRTRFWQNRTSSPMYAWFWQN